MIYHIQSETIKRVAVGFTDGIIVAQQTNQATELLFSKAGLCRFLRLGMR